MEILSFSLSSYSSFFSSIFCLNQNRHQKEICSMVSTPKKCAKPHSDVKSTPMSSLNMLYLPEDLSNQKIQKKKVLHAGISEQNGLILIIGFPSMQEGKIKLNPRNILKGT